MLGKGLAALAGLGKGVGMGADLSEEWIKAVRRQKAASCTRMPTGAWICPCTGPWKIEAHTSAWARHMRGP